MFRSIAILTVIAGLALALLPGCDTSQAESQAGPPPPDVSVAQVVSREVVQWDEFSGRVAAAETVQIRPRVSGYLEDVAYTEGQEVTEGQILFVIDQRPYRAELERAQAELSRAQTHAELTRTEVARARKLREAAAISQEVLDQRVAAVGEAEAAIRAAQAAVDVARLNLEWTEVRSPIAGRAGRAMVTEGNLVSGAPEATLLTTVVSLDPVHVYFEGDEQTYLRYVARTRSGEIQSPRDSRTPVRVGLANERGFPHEGYVDFVDNRLDAETGTIMARAVVDNAERIFTPGLFARVQVPSTGRFNALLIDDRAILTDQDRKYVFVLGEGGTALRRDIRPGRKVDGLRVVEQGLGPEDVVIVHGVQKIFFPGMPVNPHTIAMGDPAHGQVPAAAQSAGAQDQVDRS